MSVYAICPYCERTVCIEETENGACVCSACGHALFAEELQKGGHIVDVTAAEEEYTAGQQYFINSDFKEAGVHFHKALQLHKNHYLAVYYATLCDIYENEDKTEYNVPQQVAAAIIGSIDKAELCRAGLQARIDFLRATLNQSYILLSAYFNRIYDRYEKTELWDILRDKCMQIATAVKEITNIDKEKLLVFDDAIAASLVGIADLAVCACRKIVEPHMSGAVLDLPTEYRYEKAKSLSEEFLYYAGVLRPSYSGAAYSPDYTANLLYSESVRKKLEAYNAENKTERKKQLSIFGAALETFRKDAAVAVKYAYHSCFKSLSTDNKNQARIALINDAIVFCFELLMPRMRLNAEKQVEIDVQPFATAQEIGGYLQTFLGDFAAYNEKIATEYVNVFFGRLHDKVKYHYTNVVAAYDKILDSVKAAQNSEYRYYKNVLHKLLHCCALASEDVVPAVARTQAERIRFVKLGKSIAEEFFLLIDYKIGELEQSVKYADVLDIYNAFDRILSEGKRG